MISAADLPLNQRGAVYHLDLLPEEIADTIITVGDPARVTQVSRYFDDIEIKRSHHEFVTHTGYIGKKRLSVLSTGIGVPNLDIVMNELDALVNIDLKLRKPYPSTAKLTIIRLGTSGGLQANCKPGDLYATHYAIGFDALLAYYKSENSPDVQKFQQTLANYLTDECGPFYIAESDPMLLEQFKNVATSGITATCGGFYGPQGRFVRAPLRYPNLLNRLASFSVYGLKIVNFEMETSGLLSLGQLLGHRCLSLSVILANRKTGIFSDDYGKQVTRMIEQTLPIIQGFNM